MIQLKKITKKFDGHTAVNGISLKIPEGKTCVLVGPSGCGKTTTLRMINHLIEPTSGQIYTDGKNSNAIDSVELRRNIGYVIQNIGLFPHRTIEENIATTPRLKGWEPEQIKKRINQLLKLVELNPDQIRQKYPHQLSGGQKQRVGIARAMAADPPIMLMDEPFAAVDPITREHLQDMFLKIQRKMKKTIVFVTHDIDEAIKMGDKIAIFKEGRVVQYSKPQELLANPKNKFVADFVGSDRALKILNLFQVEELMLKDPLKLDLNTGTDLNTELKKKNPETVFVVEDNGNYLGWITAKNAVQARNITDAINPLAGSVEITATVKEAMAEMLQNGIDAVKVVENGVARGIMTMTYIRNYVEKICGSSKDMSPLKKAGV